MNNIKDIIKNQKKFLNGGALKDKQDNRDYNAEEILAGVDVPIPSFEEGYSVIKKYWPDMSTKDQGSTFSCVGQAWALYKQILQHKDTGEKTELSAFSIYNPIAIPGTGSYIRDGGLRTVDYGVNKESTLPSPGDEATMTRKFDFEPYKNEAAFYKNRIVAKVDTQDIDKLARMIYLNDGVVSGWGAHAVYFSDYGILNGRKYLRTPNSYGQNAELYWFEGEVQGPLFSIWTAIDVKNYVNVSNTDELLFANLKLGDSGKEVSKLLNALSKLGWKLAIKRSNIFNYDAEVAELVMNFKLANVHDFWAARLWERFYFKGREVDQKTREIINNLISKK